MQNTFDFRKKTVLVTGSARGIGYSIAELFGRCGANVVVNGKTKGNLRQTEHEFEKRGYPILAVQADVSNEKDVLRLVGSAVERFGSIDVLVNNAGVSQRRAVEQITDADWKYVLGINLGGTFRMTRAVAPFMKERGQGVIVNIVSQAIIAGGTSVHYASSKGGVVAFTKTMAVELAKYGIRVNAVMPGLIRTDMTSWFIDEHPGFKRMVEVIALGRPGLPEEVANAALFLASDLTRYITGEILAVNGGMPVSPYV